MTAPTIEILRDARAEAKQLEGQLRDVQATMAATLAHIETMSLEMRTVQLMDEFKLPAGLLPLVEQGTTEEERRDIASKAAAIIDSECEREESLTAIPKAPPNTLPEYR